MLHRQAVPNPELLPPNFNALNDFFFYEFVSLSFEPMQLSASTNSNALTMTAVQLFLGRQPTVFPYSVEQRFLYIFQKGHVTCTPARANTHTQSTTQGDLFLLCDKSHLCFKAACIVAVSPEKLSIMLLQCLYKAILKHFFLTILQGSLFVTLQIMHTVLIQFCVFFRCGL